MATTKPNPKPETGNSPRLSRPTAALTIHPALRDMPEWSDDDPQFEAMVLDISRRGFDYPIKITGDNEVVDGRHRVRGAKRLKIDEVPVEVVPEADVSKIIVSTILQRRHYTKGALAYMILPCIKGTGASQEVNAQQLGIGLTLYKQALQVREIFTSGKEGEEYKKEIEPEILSGEVGLGAVIAGWAGRQATKGKTKVTRNEVLLWERALGGLQKRFNAWDKFDATQKAEVSQQLHALVEKMPAELHGKLQKSLAEIAKQRKADK